MPGILPSTKFLEIYQDLSPDSQHKLVKRYLAKLLDVAPKERSSKVIAAARTEKSRSATLPAIDIKVKRKEIERVFEEISRHAKQNALRDGEFQRDELLSDIVDALTTWLNDIWSLVYEHHMNFTQAHGALLYTASTLFKLEDSPAGGGCKCALLTVPIDVVIKNRHEKVIKSFSFTGTRKMEIVLFWIWRELFVALLATSNEAEKEKIPSMIEDIKNAYGWQGLERVIFGGKRVIKSEEKEDPDDGSSDCSVDDDCVEDDTELPCPCDFHAPHWSDTINKQRHSLRVHILRQLGSTFENMPCPLLYGAIINLANHEPDPNFIRMKLHEHMIEMAAVDPDCLTVALAINLMECNHNVVKNLLDSHSYLLRPRDFQIYQLAVTALACLPTYRNSCFRIVEAQLIDTATSLRAAILSSFPYMNQEPHKRELTDILKLPAGNLARKDRLDAWIRSVSSPSNPLTGPMAFAAAMFGLPPPPGISLNDSDLDPFEMMDFDLSDPDLKDAQAEFRPMFRERFNGWILTASATVGGKNLLAKVYPVLLQMMPYLSGADFVSEMTSKLSMRPGKAHIADGFAALGEFCKQQKRRANLREQKKKRDAAKAASLPFPLVAKHTTPSADTTDELASGLGQSADSGPSTPGAPGSSANASDARNRTVTPSPFSFASPPPPSTNTSNSVPMGVFGPYFSSFLGAPPAQSHPGSTIPTNFNFGPATSTLGSSSTQLTSAPRPETPPPPLISLNLDSIPSVPTTSFSAVQQGSGGISLTYDVDEDEFGWYQD